MKLPCLLLIPPDLTHMAGLTTNDHVDISLIVDFPSRENLMNRMQKFGYGLFETCRLFETWFFFLLEISNFHMFQLCFFQPPIRMWKLNRAIGFFHDLLWRDVTTDHCSRLDPQVMIIDRKSLIKLRKQKINVSWYSSFIKFHKS